MRFVFLLFVLIAFKCNASHVMGGEITYKCIGGNTYVFELTFYRDCNGSDITVGSEVLRVWNHPTLTSISIPFISREDISPTCSPVSGGPSPLLCGTNANGGNGIGAIEKIIYRSDPITILGIPPSQGWAFTYENFSRSNTLTNITNPSTYGITLVAKIYANPNSTGNGCSDTSPSFLQKPSFVHCASNEYQYNPNAVDPDLDSLYFDFGIPYNNFPTGVYNPPINPIPVPFEPNFSFLSPTPNTTSNPANIAADINHQTGELKFTSFNVGNYVVKIIVKSFRQGILISEVEREMQLVVFACNNLNSAPVITAPFPGNSFETTINAGDLISFNVQATDNDLLQNGSQQTLSLTTSGPMFGTNFTQNTGCDIFPCATLDNIIPIFDQQNVSAQFNWQTSCDHLVNAYGVVADEVSYNFVFRVQDDYCQVPKVSYKTVTINLLNQGVIAAPKISCIQTNNDNSLTIFWPPVADPAGTFISYSIYSVQTGLLGTINDINTSLFTTGSINLVQDFYISVQSGCNGNILKYSDTISNIHLDLLNPINGTAILQWNKPRDIPLENFNDYYYLYREFPTGFFTFMDSVPYNTTSYIDTIYRCQEFIRYKINLPTSTCNYTSNRPGDLYSDAITPSMPTIYSVSFDTLSNNITISWNESLQEDTYGYVIYIVGANGFPIELDTVFGIATTSYTYPEPSGQGPFSYSVAAFDSCFTNAIPVTYQTSAKSPIHSSFILSSSVIMCAELAELNWTTYFGNLVNYYRIWYNITGFWELLDTTSSNSFSSQVIQGENYCFIVEAMLQNGYSSFSNQTCFMVPKPTLPSFHYFKLATFNNNAIELYDYCDASVGIKEIVFERKNPTSLLFEEIGRTNTNTDVTLFVDTQAVTNIQALEYRTKYIDSCGKDGSYANSNQTIFVQGTTDEYDMINQINWSPYSGFDGPITEYQVFRGVNGVFEQIATVPNTQFSLIDDVGLVKSNGEICYHIEGIEGLNSFNLAEVSRSNDLCFIYLPLIFIPNAFTPDGLNSIFKPILSNVSLKNYSFQIINRWGQTVFKTDDQNIGWDGTITKSGEQATNDLFLYFIVLEDQYENIYKRQGTITMIR
jgi:hypothetical protein